MGKIYRTVGVTLVLPDDQDLSDLVDALGKGNVSPWVKEAMRQRAERNKEE